MMLLNFNQKVMVGLTCVQVLFAEKASYCLVILFVCTGCCSLAEEDGTYCAYVYNRVSTAGSADSGAVYIEGLVPHNASNMTSENTSVRCTGNGQSCFSLWHIDTVDRNKVSILMQG